MNHENMVKYEDMKEKIPQVKDYLSQPLQDAIHDGDIVGLREAIDAYPGSFATEGISNRLVVRDFLVNENERLAQLDAQLDDSTEPADQRVRSYIQGLDMRLQEVFVSDDSGGKLSGDERLREVLRNFEGDKELIQHLMGVDVRELTPPQEIARWMQYVRDGLVEDLWEAVQDYRETGDVRAIHASIARISESLDRKAEGSLLK